FVGQRLKAPRQPAGSGGPRSEPEETNELEGVSVADARGCDGGALGHACHGEAHEVVAQGESPHFLRDACRGLAAQGLFALEGVRLDFVEAEFELPAFVVERDDLGGGEGHRIEQRGEQCLGAKATPLVANRPDAKSGWKVAGAIADQASGLAAGGEIDELVARPEALDDAAAQRHGAGAGAAEPMALAGGIAQLMEQSVGGEFAIEDHQRGIGGWGQRSAASLSSLSW